MIKNINKVIKQNIEFLAKSQREDGSFLSFTSSDPVDFKRSTKCQSVFSTALVLSCLNSLEGYSKAKKIKKKAVNFLLSQKSEYWTFNYWARESKQSQNMPYPDDLDDTSCVLAALHEYDPNLVDGEILAKVVLILTTLEEKEGGPYRTWLVPDEAQEIWRDVDLAVNSNIAYLLFRQSVYLPRIIKLVETAVKNKKYYSPYYPSKYPIIYFISRWYKGRKKDDIVSQLSRLGKNTNVLDRILQVSALLNFGVLPEKAKRQIGHVLKIKNKEIQKAYPFYTGINPGVKKGKFYAGSSALTTAFYLEMLSKLRIEGDDKVKEINIESDTIHQAVVKKTEQRFSILGDDLRKQAMSVLRKTIKNDKDNQIVLLPCYFVNSLDPNFLIYDSELITRLGQANLYGWMAYTIYDNFLDNEGDPRILSVANVCLRELSGIFDDVLPREDKFGRFAQKFLDKIDNANTWEVVNCQVRGKKIPKYGNLSQLAEKSIGHALGPVAILFALGYKKDSPEVKKIMKFFNHYIIARQLNDDAHDWEDDLKNGRINSVAARMLKNNKKIDIQKFRQEFWNDGLVLKVCDDIFRHAQLARKVLNELDIIRDKTFFEKIISSTEMAAEEVIRERREITRFIKAYNKS